MKVKTAKATGKQLDWGLAKVLQAEKLQLVEGGVIYKPSSGGRQVLRHTDPAVCMSLIKEHCIQLFPFCKDGKAVHWDADIRPYIRVVGCDTPEIAVARCVIAMRLGDEFECPDELEGV